MKFRSIFSIAILCFIGLAGVRASSTVTLGCSLCSAVGSLESSTVAALNRAATLGAQQVKIYADWPLIQPRTGVWNFSPLDSVVKAAIARHLQVVLVLGASPRWTVTYLGNNPSTDEVQRAIPNLAAYRAYVTAVVNRYQHQVNYYQLWDTPTSGRLLTLPRNVYALYQAGALAVHAVNPQLRVIAAEPGDIDLGWISDYLKSAQGAARADILSLSPLRYAMNPSTFAWRVQVLRERVLPKNGIPLWVEVPLATTNDLGVSMASMALLEAIANISFAPASDAPFTQLSDESFGAVTFLSGLQGYAYVGWAQLAHGVWCAVFERNDDSRILAMPLQDGEIQLATSTQALTALHPVFLSDIQPTRNTGTPDFRPEPVTSSSVALDVSGEDPAGIHPLHDFPGGHYSQSEVDGMTVLSTIRDLQPWIHFDIPDGFLFFNDKRIPVLVTVQVYGVSAPKQTGFDLYYDAVGGMSYSKWQWIDVGKNKLFTYSIRLNDAIFADREGFDLRINMGGSTENVRLRNITITKLSE